LPPKRKKPRWKEQKRDPVAFTIDEIIRLLAAAMVAPPMERCTLWTSDHWVTLIGAFLATAERFEALADCPRSALQGNVLTVPAHLTKDGKENPVVLPDWIAEKIRGLPAIGGDPRVWPYPFELRTLRERYTLDILKPAALPHSRHHKFHALRRSAVTQVKIIHGLEAAREMARHFGEGLTLKSYVSRRVERSQNGSVSFEVPKPEAPDRQQRLF
jgi:hypothetical protein